MGSIQKILDSLNRISEDKKSQINQRYDEESQWLLNELTLVKKLILRNHVTSDDIDHEIAAIAKPFVVDDPNADSQRQKRKSPEVGENNFRFSPQMKKTTSYTSNMMNDLNKLRKDQLLEELDKLGIKSFSMKALKKDLVDALRDAMERIETQTVESSTNDDSSSKVSTNLTTNLSVEPKSARKHSLLEEMRVLVASDTISTSTAIANDEDEKLKTEQEFQARQKRHRDSQIRMSQGTVHVPISQTFEESDDDNVADEEEDIMMVASNNEHVDASYQSPAKSPNSHDDNEDDIQSPMANTSWMDVASPQHVSEPESAITSSFEANHMESFASSVESNNNEEEVVSEPIMSSPSIDESDTSSVLSSNSMTGSATAAAIKKHTNILSASASFLDKPQPAKPYVQSLAVAKQAKLAEEKKAQLKKQELESKMLKNQSKPPVMTSKPAMLASKVEAKPTPSTLPAAPVKKAGLFSNPFAKKPAAVTTAATTTNIIVTAPASAVVPKAVIQPVKVEDVTIAITSTTNKPFEVKEVVSKTEPAVSSSSTVAVDKVKVKDDVSVAAMVKDIEAVKPATTTVPFKPVSTSPSYQVMSKPAPAFVSSPVSAPAPTTDENANPNDAYEFDDDESEGSGTDDEADDAAKKAEKEKRIPEWARGPKLKEALEKQLGIDGLTPMDPDLIFPEVQTCNLEEIFGSRGGITRLYSKRTSSAHWEHDTLSVVEKRTYRNQMGYTAPLF